MESLNFIDLFDWEKESDAHYMRMLEGPYFEDNERLPAKIVVNIKLKKNANKINKGAFRRTIKKRLQS